MWVLPTMLLDLPFGGVIQTMLYNFEVTLSEGRYNKFPLAMAAGKLEAKLSALNALQHLSLLPENIERLVSSGIAAPLLQLLFSVTSVLMTLREPTSSILARIAQSESILVNKDVAQQMLSLLNLCSPEIQFHLLQALNSIAAHSSASNDRRKMEGKWCKDSITWENGSNYLAKLLGTQAIIKVLESGNVKAQEKALWILERIFKIEKQRMKYGESAQVVLIDLAQNGDSRLKPTAAQLVAQLDLLQDQSSYF